MDTKRNVRLEKAIRKWARENKIKECHAVPQFATKVGYQSYRSLHNVLSGKRPASGKKQHVIAHELGSSVDFLFGEMYSN